MVMFRDFAKRNAEKLGISGVVRNQKDKTVSVVAEGEENNLKKFLEFLGNGPVLAKVEKIDVVWSDPKNEFSGFHIIY